MDDRTDILLAHYFSGEASAAELQLLDSWLAESQDHEEYFEQMTSLYRKTSPVLSMPSPDTAKALDSYKKYMQQSKQPFEKKHFSKRFFAYGAAAVAALLLGMFVFVDNEPKDNYNEFYLKADRKDTSYRISPYCEVTLFKGSHIAYNKETVDTIKLFGKATFTVDSKNGKSVLVQAGKSFIKDIGTCFTVTAFNPEENVRVEVTEGEVLFYSSGVSGIRIKKNETGYFNTVQNHFSQTETALDEIVFEAEDENEEEILLLSTEEKSKENEERESEQKSKGKQSFDSLEFHSASLGKVVKELKDRFHVDIIFEDKSMRKLQISAGFNSTQSIDEILAIIAETLSIQISRHGNVYVISQ